MMLISRRLLTPTEISSTKIIFASFAIPNLIWLRRDITVGSVRSQSATLVLAPNAKYQSRTQPSIEFVTTVTLSSQISSLSKIKTWSWKHKKSKMDEAFHKNTPKINNAFFTCHCSLKSWLGHGLVRLELQDHRFCLEIKELYFQPFCIFSNPP